eukprot:Gb_06588 [translate_table: standard]
MGIILCFITFSGHIAAETANGLSLCIYILFVLLLLLLQAGFGAYVSLNKNWEEDIPKDPTGQFNHLKKFLKDNFEICKFVGLIALMVQGLTLILALILRILGPDPRRIYDSDDDYIPFRRDLQQSFLIRTTSLSTSHFEPQLAWSDIGSTQMQGSEVVEVDASSNQASQSRIPNISGTPTEALRSHCVIM